MDSVRERRWWCATFSAFKVGGELMNKSLTKWKSASQTGSGNFEERVSSMAVGTPCRWVNESGFRRREEHHERDLADEVEDHLEERDVLDKQRALRGVLGGVDDGEREVVEDVHQKEVDLGERGVDGVVLD